MTIQDVSNILAVIEEKSINKAAARLYISQPALSKCIKKVEQEYSIVLFERSRGSGLTLTEEGRCFTEMARGIMQHHMLFESQLQQMRSDQSKVIVFACPMQRAFSISGPLMKWIYDRYPDYSMDLRTMPSGDMASAVRAGAVDVAHLARSDMPEDLFTQEVYRTEAYVYLRPGCGAGAKAVEVPGRIYPVLSMKELIGETMVSNLPGTGTRQMLDEVLRRAGVLLPVRDEANYSLRMAMVDANHASCLISSSALQEDPGIDTHRLYCLPPEENVITRGMLICREKFRNDKRFRILYEALREYYACSGI